MLVFQERHVCGMNKSLPALPSSTGRDAFGVGEDSEGEGVMSRRLH